MAALTALHRKAARTLAGRLRNVPREIAVRYVVVDYVIARWIRKELNAAITPQADSIRNDITVDCYPTLLQEPPWSSPDAKHALKYTKNQRIAAAMDFVYRALHPVGADGHARTPDPFDYHLAIVAWEIADRAARGDRSNSDPELWFAIRVLEILYDVDPPARGSKRAERAKRQREITKAVVVGRLLLAEIDPDTLDRRMADRIRSTKEAIADETLKPHRSGGRDNSSDARRQGVLSHLEKLRRPGIKSPTIEELGARFDELYRGDDAMGAQLVERLVDAYHPTVRGQREENLRSSTSDRKTQKGRRRVPSRQKGGRGKKGGRRVAPAKKRRRRVRSRKKVVQ